MDTGAAVSENPVGPSNLARTPL